MSHDMERALQILRDAPQEPPLVTIVGHMSRTRYVDQDMLYIMLSILRDTRIYRPVHAGHLPFDLFVEEICSVMGLMDAMLGPESRKDRYKPYKREPDILDRACLVLVFPPEGGTVESTDPEIIQLAEALHIPILSVNRAGRVKLILQDKKR